jgi:hypothetical protein
MSLQRPRLRTSATNSSLSGIHQGRQGYNSPDCPVAHQTVRWRTGLSSESEPLEPTVGNAINGRRVARANGRLGTPDCPVCTGQCPVLPTGPPAQRTDAPDMEGDRAPDCPVHHSTEGRNCLPSWSPTAPSCLGAIKGTPRCMEQYTKPPLSILRLPDSASTHLIDCVSDLSSV